MAVRRCFIRAQKQKVGTKYSPEIFSFCLLFLFSKEKVSGGGEESRTPVRKPIHTPFYERSLLLKFPDSADSKRTAEKGSFIKS